MPSDFNNSKRMYPSTSGPVIDGQTHHQNWQNLAIRDYSDTDWPAVCDVHDRARPLELRGSCDPRAFVPLAQDQAYADDFRDSKKFVACFADQVVGFVGVNRQCISWLYVHPAYMGRGIGRRLLQMGIQIGGAETTTVVLAGNRGYVYFWCMERN